MLSVEEALARLLAQAHRIADTEAVSTMAAHGRVLARPVVSTMDVPPMDNSQMDGYAVRCADVASAPATLRVTQRIAAGHPGQPLAPGTAARIFTGAPVPAGADAIVMQEATAAAGDCVTIHEAPKPGAWIRRAGFDVKLGATVMEAGRRLQEERYEALLSTVWGRAMGGDLNAVRECRLILDSIEHRNERVTAMFTKTNDAGDTLTLVARGSTEEYIAALREMSG